MLVISNRPRASRSSDFEITCAITPWIVLHSVQLLLLISNQIWEFCYRYDNSCCSITRTFGKHATIYIIEQYLFFEWYLKLTFFQPTFKSKSDWPKITENGDIETKHDVLSCCDYLSKVNLFFVNFYLWYREFVQRPSPRYATRSCCRNQPRQGSSRGDIFLTTFTRMISLIAYLRQVADQKRISRIAC